MGNVNSKQNFERLNEKLNYLQLSNALEEGRNEVLRMVAQNEDLHDILNTLCQKAQLYNPKMLCSVLQLNHQNNSLHPVASVSLPKFYCDALEGVVIGAGVGSCGTAAFIKERVIVEDINTHPYWSQFKGLALEAGVQACWSEPIIGANGLVYGTFAMYYREPTIPSEEDLNFIELSGNLAAVVFDNYANRQKLIVANQLLSQTIDERNHQLEQVNLALEHNLQQQKEQHSVSLATEKILTTNSLISGFSHEISTPLGNALTAITSAEDALKSLNQVFLSGKLTRKSFVNKMSKLTKIVAINERALLRITQLLTRFKEVNASDTMELVGRFSLLELLTELRTALTNLLGKHVLDFDCNNINVCCAKAILWQVLTHLIENSVEHGFADLEQGLIHINVVASSDEIIINYQDNGCGVDEQQSSKMFEPFYSSTRHNNSLGLGLSIVSNLITHVLHGKITLLSAPIGLRYEIRLGITKEQK